MNRLVPEPEPAGPPGEAGSWDPEAHGWLQGFYGGPDELGIFSHGGVRLGATDGVPDVTPDEVAALLETVCRHGSGLTFGGCRYRVDHFVEPRAVVAVADAPAEATAANPPADPGDLAAGAVVAELVAAVTENLAIVGFMRNRGRAAKAIMLLRQMVDHYQGGD